VTSTVIEDGGLGMLGRYRLLRRLAIGGMAEIFLAHARSVQGFEKLVVLKRILPQYAENAEFVRMFFDEARLAATLDHANIVQVHDMGEHEGTYFFTMEYVHGQSLLHVMREVTRQQRWFPIEHALDIVIGSCAGIHYAHERAGLDGRPLGIVHRDVSPPNVMISYDGAVKVLDFGIAQAGIASITTGVGTLKGKVPYMSPEQCMGAPLDRRSDIFSIGILLYELSVGRRLFHGDHEAAILQRVIQAEVPRPSAVIEGYPPELERVAMRALHRDPAQRYPTARALQIDLEAFAREYRIPVSNAGLAAFMEQVFPEATRRWPTDAEIAAQATMSTEVSPRPPRAAAAAPIEPMDPPSRRPTLSDLEQERDSTVIPDASADLAALDAALGRMLADGGATATTVGLGDDGKKPEFIDLEHLELEELFPAKQRGRA
jgi:serine/threonine protein kinase